MKGGKDDVISKERGDVGSSSSANGSYRRVERDVCEGRWRPGSLGLSNT